jgi:hypothetical protein
MQFNKRGDRHPRGGRGPLGRHGDRPVPQGRRVVGSERAETGGGTGGERATVPIPSFPLWQRGIKGVWAERHTSPPPATNRGRALPSPAPESRAGDYPRESSRSAGSWSGTAGTTPACGGAGAGDRPAGKAAFCTAPARAIRASIALLLTVSLLGVVWRRSVRARPGDEPPAGVSVGHDEPPGENRRCYRTVTRSLPSTGVPSKV